MYLDIHAKGVIKAEIFFVVLSRLIVEPAEHTLGEHILELAEQSFVLSEGTRAKMSSCHDKNHIHAHARTKYTSMLARAHTHASTQTCIVSLEMLSGRSSLSTTPLMKRRYSGSKSDAFL